MSEAVTEVARPESEHASKRRSASRLFVRRVFVLIAILAASVTLYTTEIESAVVQVSFAALIAIVLAVIQIAWPEESDPFSPVSWTSLYLVYSYFGIFANFIVNGEDALPRLALGTADRSRIALESIYLNAGFFALYALAYAVFYRPPSASSVETVPRTIWSGARLSALSVFCGALFFAAYFEFQRRLGFRFLDFNDLRAGKAVWRSDPSLSWMLRGIQLGFIPVILAGALAFRQRSLRKIVIVASIALLLALLVTTTGQRGIAIYPLVALGGISHYLYRPIRWKFIFVALLAMVVYVNATTRLRTGQNESFGEAVLDTSGWPLQAFSDHEMERSRLDSTAIILFHFPRRQDYLLGSSWGAILVALVPRWLWPDKSAAFPYSDGALLYHIAGLPAPTPLPALVYANFGYLGVPFWAGLMGLLHARLYAWLRRSPNDPGRPILYLVTLVFFSPTPLGVGTALQFVVPTYLSLKILERPSAAYARMKAAT